jgi:23S rRNA (guanosine2251-2'-O)-methyltransferase
VPAFVTRQCSRDACRLRFPVAAESRLGDRCPHCGAETIVDVAYDSHEARDVGAERTPGAPLEVLLDNVRSLRNVGSMFRTADGAGVSHMHLCGFTPTPEHPQMAKTALGAEASVPWTLHRDGAAAATWLQSGGRRLWALEGGPRAHALGREDVEAAGEGAPVVLVLGHEVSGVDPRILERCERVLRLPMLGMKGSLNVSVAFGIAVYWLRFGLR